MANMQEKLFNPNEHLMQIKNRGGSADYLPVQWRLVWFREQCPHGTIDTEELEVDLDRECQAEVFQWNDQTRRNEKVLKKAKGYARYRAIITDGKGGRAMGTKSERAVDFPDYAEKAETGAIGRALAALGYGTQFAGDEFDERHRIVDAPVERNEERSAPTNPAQSQAPALKDMIRKASDRAKALGITSKEAWTQFIGEALKTQKPVDQWDLNDVSRVNGELTRREREKQAVKAS